MTCERTSTRVASGRLIGAAAVLLLLTVATAQAGHWGPSPAFQPKTVRSPSGHCAFSINPGRRDARGPASYELTCDGTRVWRGTRPDTMLDAVVTDEGLVAGYSSSCGAPEWADSIRSDDPHCEMVFTVLDANGHETATHRIPARVLYYVDWTTLTPDIAGIFLDSESRHATIRIVCAGGEDDPASRCAPAFTEGIPAGEEHVGELWVPLNLKDGTLVSPHMVRGRIDQWGRSDRIVAARAVAGTPLTLVHFWRDDSERKTVGATFSLVDATGRSVWSLDLPRDYQSGESSAGETKRFLGELGAILDTTHPDRFEVVEAAKSERVTFEVGRRADEPGAWRVREIARAEWHMPPATPDPFADLPPVTLALVDETPLAATVSSAAALTCGVGRFDFDDRGNMGFIRDGCGAPRAFVLIDEDGAVQAQIPLPALSNQNTSDRVAWVEDDRWVLVRTEWPGEAVTTSWIETGTGEITEFVVPGLAKVSALVGRPDGGFILGVERGEESYNGYRSVGSSLLAFDAAGQPVWRQDREGYMFSDSLAALPNGRLGVLDFHDVEMLDARGAQVTEIDLEAAWQREPHYVAAMAPDVDGGFVVEDFGESTTLMRMRADGTLWAALRPRFADGRPIEKPRYFAASPSGRLWISDGVALLRVTGEGVVDRTIGPGPDARALQSLSDAQVDLGGRLFLYDRQSGSAHAFAADGSPLYECRPTVAAGPGGAQNWPPVVAPDGSVSLPADPRALLDASQLVMCSPDGTRREVSLRFRPEHLQGDRAPYWAEDDLDLLLVSSDGEIQRRIARRPDGDWIESHRGGAVAPDGALALTTSTQPIYFGLMSPWAVSLFTPQGDGIATITLPSSFEGELFAYDGRDIFFLRNNEVCVMDSDGQPRQKLLLPTVTSGVTPLLGPGSAEIWTWDQQARLLRRYARPSPQIGAPAPIAQTP